MGSRPTSFRKGGGFLNAVDGVLTDYVWTDEFNGTPFKAGRDPKTKKEKFHSLYCQISVRVDGAEEDVTATLFAGGYDDYEVSEDGKTLTNPEGGECAIGGNTAAGKFFSSLVAGDFPDTNFSDDPDIVNFEPALGARLRFVQRKNYEDTKRLGKRKAKDGKEYDRQDLLVDTVYDYVKVGAKPNGKTATPAKGKFVKSATEPDDVKVLAAATLTDILKANDSTITKAKLSMKVLTSLMKHPQREDVRKWLFDDDNLSELVDEGVITYDKSSKQQTISLVE